MQENIQTFLADNKVASICFVDEQGHPYCINCFYTYDETNQILIFKSSMGTKHESMVKKDKPAAGTILPEPIELTKLQGIQYTGTILEANGIQDYKLSMLYIKKFPMSMALPGYLWGVKLNTIKFTDNKLGFGNKTLWERKG